MPTLLDEIIEGSTDKNLRTPDLLRKVQIAATRIGAPEVVTWVKQELQGYPNDAEVPNYRSMSTRVMGHFTGPMQSQITKDLPPAPGFEDSYQITMRQPIIELQSFAEADTDPTVQWPMWQVQEYERSGALQIQFYGLFGAWNVISRQSLLGIVDTIRSKAMEFALELQTSFPDAGSANGPSVSTDSGVAPLVFNTTNNIYGHGANIASGTDIRQKSIVNGDLQEFQRQVQLLGLNESDTCEFTRAVDEEQSIEGSRVRAFLDRVRRGTVTFTTAISSNVIAGSLIELAKMYLGI